MIDPNPPVPAPSIVPQPAPATPVSLNAAGDAAESPGVTPAPASTLPSTAPARRGGSETVAVIPGKWIHQPPTWFQRLELEVMFPRCAPLEVELGSGDGSFLIAYATRHPERNFIGVERLLGRMRKLDRKAQRAGLENVRGLRIEASYCLEYLLPVGSTSAVHVYFPDPWPKRRHHKNRLVNERFVELAARALLPAGCLHLRTDDADYFDQMRRVFGGSARFSEVEPPEELIEVQTDFERGFLAQGIATRRASYRSTATTPASDRLLDVDDRAAAVVPQIAVATGGA